MRFLLAVLVDDKNRLFTKPSNIANHLMFFFSRYLQSDFRGLGVGVTRELRQNMD